MKTWKWFVLGLGGLALLAGVVVIVVVLGFIFWPSKGPQSAAQSVPQELYGTYTLVRETSGTVPVKGASVTLRLAPANQVIFRAKKPDQIYGDMGTFSVADGRMTIAMRDLEQAATDAEYSFDGTTLVLPIVVLGEGPGTSTWTRRADKADPMTKVSDTFWEHYFTDGPVVALEKAAEGVRKSPDVAAATIGGRTLFISYKNGHEEFFLAPKLPGEAKKPKTEAPPAPESESEAVAEEGAVPGNMWLAQMMPMQGIRGVAGLATGKFDKYSDWLRYQPEPISAGDAPPDKRALLFSPFHSLPHFEHVPDPPPATRPARGRRGTTPAPAPTPTPKKQGTALPVFGEHEKLEEIGKHLEKIDYMVLPYMDAAVDLDLIYKKLHGHNWGVIYFNTHCGEITRPTDDGGVEHAGMLLATGEQIPDAYAESPSDRAAYLERTARAALGGDYERLKHTVIEGMIDESGVYFIALKSQFFKSINCDYSRSLVFLNGCESAKFADFRRDFAARSFVGWSENAQIEMGSRVSEPFFNCITRKTFADREAVFYTINYVNDHYYTPGNPALSRGDNPVEESHRYWAQRAREDARTWNFHNLKVYRQGKSTPEQPFPFHVANLMRVTRRWVVERKGREGLRETLEALDTPNLEVGINGTDFYKQAFDGVNVTREMIEEAKFELAGDGSRPRLTLVEK